MEMKPLVSLCVFTYNQEKFVLDALQGAISQTYDNLEIIVSDDCSKDKTFEIIENFAKEYKGSHKLKINRNEKNLGIRGHFNYVLKELMKGEIFVGNAGDDKSEPDRVEKCVSIFQKQPEVTSVFCDSLQTDVNLTPLEEYHSMCSGQTTIITLDDYVNNFGKNFWLYSGDSRVMKKEVFEKFPPMTVCNNEDIPTFVRSIILGPVAFIREPLVLRRIHENNESKKIRIKQEGINLFKQLNMDVEYAREKGYIDEHSFGRLKMKFSSIKRQMLRTDMVILYSWLRPVYAPLKRAIAKVRY